MTTEILLVDDNLEMLGGIHLFIKQMHGFKVVAEARDGLQAIQLIRKFKPDVVVMDITMPYMNGIDATQKIVSENPWIKVIALSIHSEWAYVANMLESGASGYLLKDCIFDELEKAIKIVVGNGIYISKKINDGSGILIRERLSRKQKAMRETNESI